MRTKPLLTASEMRALEHSSIETWGISSLVLQEHAALGALALLPEGLPLLILAGPGNNGGDALALARLARLKGREVQVWRLPGTAWRGDAAQQARLWEGMGGVWSEAEHPAEVLKGFHGWIVDGLFGLGTRLPLPDSALAWIKTIEHSGLPVLALDQPTGLDPSSGDLPGPVLRATRTACFGALKVCHGLRPAKDVCGEVTVLKLPLRDKPESALHVLEMPRLEAGRWNAHKGDFGHVGIRAGSLGMSGAAVLASLGALRGGAGLVTLLVDAEIRSEVAGQVPESMVQVWQGSVPECIEVLLVGPGGVDHVPDWQGPLVLDASALQPGQGSRWSARPQTVLTPHPGEFARLFEGCDLSSRSPMVRLESLRLQAHGPAVMVLKGAQTLIAGGGDERVLVNDTGHSGLSTGGSGDFLAGLVAARISRRVRAGLDGSALKVATAEAVWLHGAAADRLGPGPLLVRELGPALSAVLKECHEL